MSTRKLPRRAFLRGTAATALALPLFDSLSAAPARAASQAPPKRCIFFFSPDGCFEDLWLPNTTGTSFSLKPVWAPLEPFKDKLLVASGLDAPYATEQGAPGDAHQAGMGGLLTGKKLHSAQTELGNGISLDQFLGQELCVGLPHNAIVLGAKTDNSTVWHRLSYSAPLKPVDPLKPRAAYDKLFKNVVPPDDSAGQAELERQIALRRGVLDAVRADIGRVKARLSLADRVKLEEHLTAIDELDQKLGIQPGAAAACVIPDYDALPTEDTQQTFPAVVDAQIELATRALACDLTRVVTLQLSYSVSNLRHTWADVDATHHDEISHNKYGKPKTWVREETGKIVGWYAKKLALLLEKLASVPEGDGTLLDNTLVYWCSDLADGMHSRSNYPVVLAGGAGGALQTGRHLSFADRALNDVLITIAHAMDVPLGTFGDPDYCKGVLPGVLATS
jgi:hypothetical protein